MPYVGLINEGNSCFINAIIQMLYRIPEFVTTYDTSKEPGKTLDRFFTNMRAAEKSSTPSEVRLGVTGTPTDFECPISTSTKTIAASTARKGTRRKHEDAEEFLSNSIFDKIGMDHLGIFTFSTIEKTYCKKGNNVADEDIRPPEIQKMLELAIKKCNTIQKCINQSIIENQLGEGNEIERCKNTKTKSYKQTRILSEDPQEYLILRLKRFTDDTVSKTINIETVITVSGKQWALQGAVLHTGTLAIGHYRYLWKSPQTWILFDDARVFNPATNVQYELNNNGYILLYKKCEGAACPTNAATPGRRVTWPNNTRGNNGTKQNITIARTAMRTRSRNRNTTHANSKPPTNAKLPPANAKPLPANNKRRRTQKKKYGFKSFIKSLLTPKDKGEYEKLIYREDPLIKELVLNKVVPR